MESNEVKRWFVVLLRFFLRFTKKVLFISIIFIVLFIILMKESNDDRKYPPLSSLSGYVRDIHVGLMMTYEKDKGDKSPIAGEFFPNSYASYQVYSRYNTYRDAAVLVISIDASADKGYVGISGAREMVPWLKDVSPDYFTEGSFYSKAFKNAKGDYYDGGDVIFEPVSIGYIYLGDWEIIQTPQGRRLRPYWNEERARKIFRLIPRNNTSVTAIVQKGGQRLSGIGSSVRAAVASALPGDTPFASPDIEQLTVITNGDYRLHEINAAVFSDDLAFIRTTLGNLEHLDLSQARFYNDIVPRSALDCSKNIEYAYNLPKGNLPKLERVDLPPVVSVDWYAFRNLPALKNINLPNTRHIAAQAFEGCVSLSVVNAPKLETLGQGAFFRGESLSGIVFPKLNVLEGDAFASSQVNRIALPRTVTINTYDFSVETLLLLDRKNENRLGKIKIHQNSPLDILVNGRFELSKDFFVPYSSDMHPTRIFLHPYTMPHFNPQLTAEEITVAVGTSADIPIRFTDKNVTLRMTWGHSDNPSSAQITADGKISASVPGKAVLTLTDIVADVTLPVGKKAHVFSNWPVELKNPLQLRVKVE